MTIEGKKNIFVTFKEEDDFLNIDVVDTGTGINEDIREKVLIPFFTTKGVAHSGAGMGLSCTHGILKKRGGTVIVMPNDSTTGGAHVRLRIPLFKETATSGAA